MVGTFNPKYTYTKRGIYYFSKDVPADLRHHYTKLRIVQSLRTKSSTRAKHAAQSLVTRLEDYWFNLRLKEAQIPAAHLLRQAPNKDRDLAMPTIAEALELYQRVKGEGRVKTFFSHSSRSINYLTECLGCRPLNQYSSPVWEYSMSNIVSWEEAELQKINEFLEPHDWAAKGPVRLIYHTDFLHGGRLYTPYQNIPTRRVDVRKRTLIDGVPLSEVDFSANQLRLQLAVLFQLNAGDDPYGEIATIACIQDIQTIKTFMVIAMGADSRAKAAGACWKKGINKTQFDAITEATWRRWPRLELFTGWTHQGQNLEGQILKKVLLQGVDAGIVCLPVHDAVAVQRRHVDWAVEAMTNAWAEIAYGLRPKVKVE